MIRFQGISAMSDSESDLNREPPVSERAPRVVPGAPIPYGTEARIASMEAHVDHMRDDLGDMRRDYRELTKALVSTSNDMRALDDRVSSLPGRGFIFICALLFTIIICAVIIYVDKIRDYLGGIFPPHVTP
jgi:hypothetical protein